MISINGNGRILLSPNIDLKYLSKKFEELYKLSEDDKRNIINLI